MATHHLAQINVARFMREKTDPANADFMAALGSVNAAAEASPGFVWRLVGDTDADNAVDVEVVAGDPRLIINMSVWRDLEALAAFTYREQSHLAIMRRRREWFEPMPVSTALWWVPAGHRPTVAEGMARLDVLARRGPSADAFTFREPFAAPVGQVASASP